MGINIFTITRREFFALATVITLYWNLDVLLQIIVAQNKMSKEILKKKFMSMNFKIYIFLLISIVYFPLPIAWKKYVIHNDPRIHINLFESTIGMYQKVGLHEVIQNIGGNLILLTPMILFLCYYFKKLNFNIKNVLLMSLGISLFIECSQVTLSMIIPNYTRAFDTMDLICNSISGVIGYLLYKFYNKVVIEVR